MCCRHEFSSWMGLQESRAPHRFLIVPLHIDPKLPLRLDCHGNASFNTVPSHSKDESAETNGSSSQMIAWKYETSQTVPSQGQSGSSKQCGESGEHWEANGSQKDGSPEEEGLNRWLKIYGAQQVQLKWVTDRRDEKKEGREFSLILKCRRPPSLQPGINWKLF